MGETAYLERPRQGSANRKPWVGGWGSADWRFTQRYLEGAQGYSLARPGNGRSYRCKEKAVCMRGLEVVGGRVQKGQGYKVREAVHGSYDKGFWPDVPIIGTAYFLLVAPKKVSQPMY